MEIQKSASRINCCAFNCSSRKGRDRNLSFHSFPKINSGCVFVTNKLGIQEKIDRRKAWELKLLMKKSPSQYMRVCSRHFQESDFILPGFPSHAPQLKKNAVPSQHLPIRSFSVVGRKRRPLIRKETVAPITASSSNNYSEDVEICRPSTSAPADTEQQRLSRRECDAIYSLLQLNDMPSVKAVTFKETGIQVQSGDICVPFITCIDTDTKLSSMTGLPALGMLDVLVNLVTEHFPDRRTHKLSAKERIVMTFMKMKTGLRYAVLASLFTVVTSKTCKIIFHDTISQLAVVLKPVIIWPSACECRSNLPKCFQKFENVRVVLDCTEFPINRSKRLCCRIRTYSHYKGTQTIKFLTGVSPAGLITFISRAYGGRASDKAIFEQSGLIEKLDHGKDAIMVDKGFRIEDITNVYNIKVIQRPFLKKKKQLTEEEARNNVAIAKARVHIERTYQRIKLFEIFTKPLPLTLVQKIEEMFMVACAVVNLSSPILGDDKFLT